MLDCDWIMVSVHQRIGAGRQSSESISAKSYAARKIVGQRIWDSVGHLGGIRSMNWVHKKTDISKYGHQTCFNKFAPFSSLPSLNPQSYKGSMNTCVPFPPCCDCHIFRAINLLNLLKGTNFSQDLSAATSLGLCQTGQQKHDHIPEG